MSNLVKGVLLDIEGTTSSIDFVYDVMFPYARKNFAAYLQANFSSEPVQAALPLLAADLKFDSVDAMFACLLYTSPSPRDKRQSRMPSSA